MLLRERGYYQPESVSSAASEAWTLGDVRLADFLEQKHERPRALVGKFLQGSVNFIYGGAGSMKTWLAMEIVRQAAERGIRTLYLFEEGLPAVIQDRFRWMDVNGQHVRVAIRPNFILHERAKLDQLIDRVRETRAEIVVLDPLSDMVELNEADQSEMRLVRGSLKRLASETGACIIVLHHSTKSGAVVENPKFDMGATQANMRGSGVLLGMADMLLEVRPEKDCLNRSTIHMTKNRNGAKEAPGSIELVLKQDVEPWQAQVTWIHGESARKALEERRGARQRSRSERQEKAENLVLRLIEETPGLSSRVLKAAAPKLQLSTDTIDSAIGCLRLDGLIENRGSDRKAKWFRTAVRRRTKEREASATPLPCGASPET
jgi:hypothetical protein